jgi:hypothetical protein
MNLTRIEYIANVSMKNIYVANLFGARPKNNESENYFLQYRVNGCRL